MGRSRCCEKAHTNKGAWTKEEDFLLISHIRLHGEGCWRSLPQAAGLMRCGKSCRLRWINYLRPDLKRGNFTRDEDELIIKLHGLLGNKWSLIAASLPGRTDNEIKNYWHTRIKRKLIGRGVDPTTHRPFPGSSSSGARSASPPPPPPPIPAAEIALAMPSPEEGYCRSGITEGGGGEGFQVQDQLGTVDLELSIGLSPFQSKPKRPQAMPSRQHLRRGYELEAGRATAAACICCNLARGDCSNCGGGPR